MPSGFNGTILIIEERFSGESSSTIGNEMEIILLTVDNIFKKISEIQSHQFFLSASYAEICSECVKDLLEEDLTDIELLGDTDPLIAVQNLKKHQVHSPDSIPDLIAQGTRKRNYETSSHTIFSISLESQADPSVGDTTSQISRLNFLFLTGCADLVGASGDQLEKCCPHFSQEKIISLLNGNQEKYVSLQENILYTVLKHFVEESSVLCTVSTGASVDFLNSTGFTSKSTEVEKGLEQITALPDAATPGDHDCNAVLQGKPNATSCNEKSADMTGQPSSSPIFKHIPILKTIAEEEEADVDTVLDENTLTFHLSTGESKHDLPLGEDEQCCTYGTLPLNMGEGTDDAIQPQFQKENGEQDLDYTTETTSELLEHISYYQMKYDELREFTCIEKKMYEESFSIELSEANSKIQELQAKSKHLETQLQESNDKCKDVTSTLILLEKSKRSGDDSNENAATQKELALLKQQLLKSEMKRNDCEMRLELVEGNFRNQSMEFKQCLEEAWTELSNYGELNENDLINELPNVTGCEEQKDRLPIEITDLKEEISALKRENARYASLSQKIHKLYKLKKSVAQESKLLAKISDLEREVHALKDENLKLSENLNIKIVELRELNITQLLFKEEICLMENEKAQLSKTLEEVKSLNSENLYLKEEADRLRNENSTASSSLEEKCQEIGNLSSENSNMKTEISIQNDEIVCLSKMLGDTTEEVKGLHLCNSKLKEEIDSVKSDNLNISNMMEENILEITKLSSEKTVQQDKVCSVKCNAAKIEGNTENSQLKDEISSLKYKISSLTSSDEQSLKTKDLVSENVLLKKEICSHMNDITHLSDCVEKKSIKIKELDSHNNKLKEEMSLLKQNTLKISKNAEEKITEIEKLLNENIILKDEISSLKVVSEKVSEEMIVKVKELNSENSLLKENIRRLACELEEKTVELGGLNTKLEEKKLETDDLKTEVSVLKKEILDLHEENICVSEMLNRKIQDVQPQMILSTNSELILEQNNISMKENVNLPNIVSEEYELERLTLKDDTLSPGRMRSVSGNPRLKEKPQSGCTNLIRKISLQRANCLRRKVARQRKILKAIQKRELLMKTNLELYKGEVENLQCLKQNHALQKYRILQLELQAQHEDYVHKTRTNCLESFVASLRNENVVLQTQLHHVQSQMKNLAVQYKTKKCGQLKHKHVAVKTSLSESGSGIESDGGIVQEYDLPNVRVETCNTEDQKLFSPNEHHLGKTGISHAISNVQIESKRIRELRTRNKFYDRNFVEKNLPKISTVAAPSCKYNQNEYTGLSCIQSFSSSTREGAEGWARLERDFDFQHKTGSCN